MYVTRLFSFSPSTSTNRNIHPHSHKKKKNAVCNASVWYHVVMP
jgi:hypothetical protein